MKFAVISDIHSNLHALQAAQERIEENEVEIIVCAGDIVGYGAFPNECCEIVRKLATHCIFGNHEVSALTRDTIWMNPYAAKASKWTSDVLNQDSRDYLVSLEQSSKFETAGTRVAMHHGSIESVVEYVYEDDARDSMLSSVDADILILGHTHIPYMKKFGSGLILNPGSVGQPRDGDPRGSLAVIDSEASTCSIIRFDYDIESAWTAIVSAGLPDYLGERLFIGR
jgi:putative phosphoesterase